MVFRSYKRIMVETKIKLPKPVSFPSLSLEEAIRRRRSERDYTGQAISLSELSYLLLYTVGITEERYGLRAAPSAGALYPIEIYPVVNRVTGLAGGIYHYQAEAHSLELIKEGDFRHELMRYALSQELMRDASIVLALTVILERAEWKYGERAYRYALLEAGHIGQNIYLVATSLGLGACAVGAYSDSDYNRLIGVDGERESVVYLLAVGKLREK